MKVKNRPDLYVKRSSLPGRCKGVEKVTATSNRQPKERDFMTVEIDESFYFNFRSKPSRKTA